MQGALTAQAEVVNIARELLAGATNGHTEDIIHLVPELGTPSDRLPFNKVCRGPQRIAWGEIPMADIKAIRESCGGTVNDVVLTVMTSTIRRYAELHGVKVRGRHLRIIVPVNIRGNGDIGELGNRITFLPINVPLDVRDPRALLARVSERMVFLRSVGVADLVGLVGTLVSKIPLPLQAVLAPLLTQLPLSLCNMICTNVPGPQQSRSTCSDTRCCAAIRTFQSAARWASMSRFSVTTASPTLDSAVIFTPCPISIALKTSFARASRNCAKPQPENQPRPSRAAARSKVEAATRPVKLRTIAISPAAKPARKKAQAAAPACKATNASDPGDETRRISSRQ